MKCADCRWYNYENEVCLKDGYSVFNPGADDPCEYVDNMTVLDRITASPDVLAEKFVYDWGHLCHNGDIRIYWKSTILPDAVFGSKAEAIAATVEKLKEVEE